MADPKPADYSFSTVTRAQFIAAIAHLQAANADRQKYWDPNNLIDSAYRGNELAGETGEACNVIKKLRREELGIKGSRDTLEHLGEELADVVICVCLIANHFNIKLGPELIAKFNGTSDANELPTHL